MIAALVALGGTAMVVFARSCGLFGRVGVRPRLVGSILLWAVAAASFWLALRQQGFDPQLFGMWSFGWQQAGYGLLFGVLGLLSLPAYVLVAKRLGGQPQNADALREIASASLIQRLFLLVTAAGAEELIFRAVAIGSLMAAGFPRLAAVGAPFVVFVLLHRSSWGLMHLLFVAVAGALMTGAFVLGGLWAAMIAHLIVDAPMMLAGKVMAKRTSDFRNLSERI